MSDPKDIPLNEHINKLSRAMGDIMITDVFTKHGIKAEDHRKLSPEQKDEIKKLVEDIKQQVESFLQSQKNPKEKTKEATAAAAEPQASTEAAPQPKRRLGLKRKANLPESSAPEPTSDSSES